MRLTPCLFLLAAVLLLAKSEGGPAQLIEVRSSNSRIEITGSDSDRVQVDDSSHAAIRNLTGHIVVEPEGQREGEPLKLQVPRNAALDVVTSNGEIRIAGVAGAMRLSTSNGGITVQGAGTSEIHAHTSNGKIEVALPRSLNANLLARTSNGRIHSDLEIAPQRRGDNYLEGKIGDGGPAIDLQTSNGTIHLTSDSNRESVKSTFRPGEVK